METAEKQSSNTMVNFSFWEISNDTLTNELDRKLSDFATKLENTLKEKDSKKDNLFRI